MRVLIAPDAFGGTLTAAAAAAAVAQGWLRRRADDVVRCVPMADGGDGTLAVAAAAVPGARRRTVEVADARGIATSADWLQLPDGRALVESAQACGLHRLPHDRRNPRLATTYGVGQLIAAAAEADAREILVGLGGSATVDAGAGMATALGHRLLRDDGNHVKVGGEYLAHVRRVVPAPQALRLPVTAGVDVDAVLLGDDGAVAGFARQKGAQPDDLEVLETALRTFADVVERDVKGGPWRWLPGAGAAGGTGFAMAALLGAPLRSGAHLVGELVDLPAAVASADVVVTGEGRLDRWSARGKVPGYVATLGRNAGARVLAVAGGCEADAGALFDDVSVLGEAGLHDPQAAVAAAAGALAERLGGRG